MSIVVPQIEELSDVAPALWEQGPNHHSATAVHVVSQQAKLDAFVGLFEATDNICASLVEFVELTRKAQKPVASDHLQVANRFALPPVFGAESKGYFTGGLGGSDISSGTSESTYPRTFDRSRTSSPLSKTSSPPRSVSSSSRIVPTQAPIGTGRIPPVPSPVEGAGPGRISSTSPSPGPVSNPNDLRKQQAKHFISHSGYQNPLGIYIVIAPPENPPAPDLPKWNSNGRRFTAELAEPDDIPLRDLPNGQGNVPHTRPAYDKFSATQQKKMNVAFASTYMWPLVPFRRTSGNPPYGRRRPAPAKRAIQVDYNNVWKYPPHTPTPRVAQLGIRGMTNLPKSDESSRAPALEKSLRDALRYKTYNDSVEESLETNAMRRHLAERRSLSPVNDHPPGEFSDFPICEMSIAMGLHDASFHRNSSFND